MRGSDGPADPSANPGRHEILGHVVGPRPVMCAIGDGDEAPDAVRAAAWLAQALDAELVLTHAFDPMGIPARPRTEMVAGGITDDHLEAGVARCRTTAARSRGRERAPK